MARINDDFVYSDDGKKILGSQSPDGSISSMVVKYPTIGTIPIDQGVYQLPDGTLYSVNSLGVKTAIGSGLALISNLSDSVTAITNSLSIQSAIDNAFTNGLQKVIINGGTATISPSLVVYSNIELEINANLISATGRQTPVIRSKYDGNVAGSVNFSRASNIATVQENQHRRKVGDFLNITGGSDTSFRGQVTVTAVTSNSWSYASTGSNTTVITGTYYNIIPIRRSIPGASFSATAGYITVTDVAHKMLPGWTIFLSSSTGSSFAPGMVKIVKASLDTWTYFVSGATGTGTGTTYLSYDNNITLSGSGAIDGNRANQGSSLPGYQMMFNTASFGAVNGLTIKIPIGGSSIRGLNANNCTDISLVHRWSAFDCLVGAQMEGGCDGFVADNFFGGDAQLYTTGAQQADDYIAFTGVINASGAGGNYDEFISPYGLTFFDGIDVRRLKVNNALNGVKITSDVSCPFRNIISIGSIRGVLMDNNPSTAVGAAVRVMDDGPGLTGTTIDMLIVNGPIVWSSPTTTKSASNISFSGTGTANKVILDRTLGAVGNTAAIIQTGMNIKSIVVSNSRFPYMGINEIPLQLTGGTVGNLVIDRSTAIAGVQGPWVYLGGASIKNITFNDIDVGASDDATSGFLIDYGVAAGLETITFNGVKQSTETANRVASLLKIGNIAIGTLKATFNNIKIGSASIINCAGTTATGTVNVYCSANVEWAASGGGNFIQAGSGFFNLVAPQGFTVNAETIALFGFGTPTYRLSVPSSFAQVNMNNASTYGSAQLIPVNGDEMYNSTGGVLPAGRLLRRAGVWAAL